MEWIKVEDRLPEPEVPDGKTWYEPIYEEWSLYLAYTSDFVYNICEMEKEKRKNG